MTLGFLIILFGLAPKARAAIVGGTVDTTGTVTGITGATYYNVSNWQDMIDTYKGVTPNAASSNTVFLNVTANVPGNRVLVEVMEQPELSALMERFLRIRL